MPIINDRIKERRIQSGLTLLQVADRLGVKEATAQRYESGEIKNIKHETIISLSEIFNCTPAYLLGWDDSPLIKTKTDNRLPFEISIHEIKVITAYHNQPEMQPAVDKLLGIERGIGVSANNTTKLELSDDLNPLNEENKKALAAYKLELISEQKGTTSPASTASPLNDAQSKIKK